MRAIGLMSGTSLDGIDVASIETDGERITGFGPAAVHAYRPEEREMLRRALDEARGLHDRAARPGVLAAAERMITQLHAGAVETFLAENHIARESVGIVGFHGQTVLHRPADRLTVQIGDGGALANEIRLPVAYDFRAEDVAAGGQGAPLVPVYHRAIAAMVDRPLPLMIVNIGGVSNITYLDADLDAEAASSGPRSEPVACDPEPVACDTGPGNALIDDFMRARTGAACDEDGATAARGKVHGAWIDRVLAAPFFASPPPKSLDRNAFAQAVGELADLSVEDGAATLTALTAAAIARIVPLLRRPPASVIVAGGGARNPTLMRMLAQRLAPATVETASAAGWSGDALEAQAFAFLAVRRLRGLPITFPATTGVPRAMTGGTIAAPAAGRSPAGTGARP